MLLLDEHRWDSRDPVETIFDIIRNINQLGTTICSSRQNAGWPWVATGVRHPDRRIVLQDAGLRVHEIETAVDDGQLGGP